jgi:MFS family permease
MTLTPELTRVGRHRAPEASRLRGNAWWTLAAVSIGVIMVGLDASVVTIANPRIAADLHASLSDLQWITDAYLLALASLLIFGGKLGDRFGRREIFFIGVAGFALTSIGIGMIGTVAGVIGLRALQGLFGALLMPSTLAIIRSTFPPEKLNTAVGIWGAASGVSIAAGPIVGGLLVEHVNWQSVFYINAPIALAALVIGAMAIVESRSEHAHHLDVPGIVALSGGLSLIVFGLIKAQNWGWLAGETLAVIAAGVLALVMFGVIELRSVEPLLPMRLFANRSLSIGTAVVVINFFALFGARFFMTLYLQNVHGFSPFDAGVRTLPLSLALMVSAPLSGVVTERFGPRAVAGVRAVGCRHRARADGELRCDRRQRERRRRRRGGRSSEHRCAARRGAWHDDSRVGAEQPGGVSVVRRAHCRGNARADRREAGTCEGTHRAGCRAVDSGRACAVVGRDRRRQPQRVHGRAAHIADRGCGRGRVWCGACDVVRR